MINLSILSQLDWQYPWALLLALQPLLMGLLLRLRRERALRYAAPHLLPWAIMNKVSADNHSRWRVLHGGYGLFWILLALAAAGPRIPDTTITLDVSLIRDSKSGLLSPSPLGGEGGERGVSVLVPAVINYGTLNKQVAQETRAGLRRDVDIMVVLNLSPSMLTRNEQSQVQRLERAKLESYDLLQRLQGERVGLTAYAETAGMLFPPSEDYQAFKYYLGLTEPGLFELPKGSPAAVADGAGVALQRALRQLQQEKSRSRAVLLFTDGETSALNGEAGAQLLAAARMLKEAGIPLFILGVGQVGNAADETNVMDETRLKEFAHLTGGDYARVSDGDGDWRSLYDNGLLRLPSEYRPPVAADAWQALYPWLLIPAVLLMLLRLFAPRRAARGSAAAMLRFAVPLAAVFIVVFISAPVQAASNAGELERSAHLAYQAQDYVRAQLLYTQIPGVAGRLGEGVSAYRRKDYVYAAHQFTAALLEATTPQQRADALFNLGNSEFMLSRYAAAAEAYQGVLNYRAGDKKALANLDLAASRLAATRRVNQNNQGILGRRGNQVGGKLGEDISDKPVAIEETKDQRRFRTQEETEAAKKVAQGEAMARGAANADGKKAGEAYGSDLAFKAAAKKLELVQDKPRALFSALFKYEADRAEAEEISSGQRP